MIRKANMGPIEFFQHQRGNDKLDELWCLEYDLNEEGYRPKESRGASMGVMRSPKYSQTPLNRNFVRPRRTERARGDGRRLDWSG